MRKRFKIKTNEDPEFYLGDNVTQSSDIPTVGLAAHLESTVDSLPEALQTYIKVGSKSVQIDYQNSPLLQPITSNGFA